MQEEDQGGEPRLTRQEQMERDFRLLEARYLDLINSPGHRLIQKVNALVRRGAPSGSRRASLAYAVTKGADLWLTYGFRPFLNQLLRPGDWWARLASGPGDNLNENYSVWLSKQPALESLLPGMLRKQEGWAYRPRVSVLMPVYNPDSAHLQVAIHCIQAQVYPDWELCLADDGSTDPSVLKVLREAQASDERIHLVELARNAGISAATNAARGLASGEYLAFADHDDVIYPEALHSIVDLLNEHRELDFVYSDEDQLTTGGLRINPFFKPAWSPELLESMNYMTHLAVLRASVFDEVGGLRSSYDGSQDYDLFLRVSRHTSRIGHVPSPLYSWRRTIQSAASMPSAKPWAFEAARRALDDHLAASGRSDRAKLVSPGRFRLTGQVPTGPLVSIVIPTRDRPDLLAPCLASLRKISYGRVEVVIVDNGTVDLAASDLIAAHQGPVVSVPGEFNFPRLIAAGAKKAHGEYLLFLNNDVIAPSHPWVEELLRYATRPGVAAVGGRLLYPSGQPQHEGIALFAAGVFAYNVDWRGYMSMGDSVHNCSAVTAACMMTPRAVFDELGGFDQELAVAYNDVDYCLRAIEAGYRIVYTPHAQLTHIEAATRINLHPPGDEQLAKRRWEERHSPDHYLNPELARIIEPFTRGQDRRKYLGHEVSVTDEVVV